jgi:signal transduction histidine kinase
MFRDYKIDISIREAYSQHDKDLRIKRLKTTIVLGMLFVLGFGLLDFVVYPDIALKLNFARIITAVILSIMLYILDAGWKVNIKFFGIFIPTIVFILIDVLVFFTEGSSSSYYAGLTLTIVALSTLLPWTFQESLIACCIMVILYLLTSVIHHEVFNTEYNFKLLANNVFFLVAIGTFCVVACYLNSKVRFKEFCLNYELGESNEKLSKMDKLKSQFFANVSHEFRTPLTLILGPVQDILHDPFNKLPPKINNIFNLVQQNGLRLLKLVNDLLDVIRLEEGKADLKLQKIEMNSLVAGVTDSMMHLADMQQVELKKEIDSSEAFVSADPSAIDKIIINLLNNAIKFTPKGGKIILSTKVGENKFIIKVKDTGIGIGTKDLPYIFDRFAQADSSSTREYQGTGIGLALVKELIELQNGKISVVSKISKGTTFTLEFTLFNEEEEKLKLQNQEPQKEKNIEKKDLDHEQDDDKLANIHKTAYRMGGLVSQYQEEEFELESAANYKEIAGQPLIIVVDDEVDMRNYITGLLREQGYKVLYASDGEAGLKMIQELQPDLAVLDLMLPKMDGLEVCKKLKSDESTKLIKVILLTARVDEEAKLTALRNGADDFVTKPFNALEVKGRVKNLLENGKLQSDIQKKNDELQSALQDLRTTQGQLIQSEKINALGNLAAGLLHEVNNPLNYTLTALQMVKMDPAINGDADLKDMVKDMEEGMGRIKAIITDLRAFAYPEESSKEVAFSIFSAVNNAIKFTSHDSKDVEIRNEISQDVMVNGSQTHIVQILINLITNAIKAIDKTDRKGLIIIRCKQDGNRIVIYVRDNGNGMSAETLKKVFDPFFTTRDVGEGMGLGLSICHTIAKTHGGSMSATSVENEGSEFYFDLAVATS